MIPFTIKINGKRQVIMAKNGMDARIKAEALLQSRKMLLIPVRLRPLTLKTARRIR